MTDKYGKSFYFNLIDQIQINQKYKKTIRRKNWIEWSRSFSLWGDCVVEIIFFILIVYQMFKRTAIKYAYRVVSR